MNKVIIRLFIILSLSACLFAGCGKNNSTKNPLYLRGIQLRDEGEPVAAERFLKRYLAKEPDSLSGCLALAGLYDEALGNPAAALYYYDEYLRLSPENDPERSTVESYRNLTRAKLFKQLTGETLPELPETEVNAENRRLRKTIEQLRRYIQNQNLRLAELQNQSRNTGTKSPSPVADNQTYTVRAGDTPGSIARQFYGSSSKYPKIMEANQLSGSGNLRVGQQLIIPPDK
ncbi:MAG: LysM peptidoglycan-binding domain-containing protein [Victivallales bacterium]|jgi:LysM repeat protein|nr:LysM peptidoglycan-binding domain-containing protein [Victivallales bacterium]